MARNRTHDFEIQTFILSPFLPKMGVWIASFFDFILMYPPLKVFINHHHRVFILISNFADSKLTLSRFFYSNLKLSRRREGSQIEVSILASDISSKFCSYLKKTRTNISTTGFQPPPTPAVPSVRLLPSFPF